MTKTNLTPHLLSSNSVASANDIHPLKAPVHIANPWFWITLAGALILAAIVAWWLWRRSRRPAPPAAAEPEIPPHEKALERLKEALALLNQPRPFCILTSDTIRIYLEERFDLRAPERTTEEFLEELQTSALLTFDQKKTLGQFLTGCDLVKFARYEPEASELQSIYEVAVRLVEETQPSPPPPEPAAAPLTNPPAP